MTFSTRLKHALAKSSTSRKSLAESLGVNPVVIDNWCHKRTPRHETLLRIANVLNVSPRWLQTGEGEMEPQAQPPPKPPVNLMEVESQEELLYRLVAELPATTVLEIARTLSQDPDKRKAAMGLELAALKQRLEKEPAYLERLLGPTRPEGGPP